MSGYQLQVQYNTFHTLVFYCVTMLSQNLYCVSMLYLYCVSMLSQNLYCVSMLYLYCVSSQCAVSEGKVCWYGIDKLKWCRVMYLIVWCFINYHVKYCIL